MSEETKNSIGQLKERQELLRKKSFFMLIEIAFIFGIPAVIAFIAGGSLDERFGTGNTIILSSLAFAFMLSWAIMIIRFRSLQKQFKEIAEKIKAETDKTPEDAGGNKSSS